MYNTRITQPEMALIILTKEHSFVFHNADAKKLAESLQLKGCFFEILKDTKSLIAAIEDLECQRPILDVSLLAKMIINFKSQTNVLITNEWHYLTPDRTAYCHAVLDMTALHYTVKTARNLARLDIERKAANKLKEELESSYSDEKSQILDMLFEEHMEEGITA